MAEKIKVKLYDEDGKEFTVALRKQTISNRAKVADEDIRTNALAKDLREQYQDVIDIAEAPKEPSKHAPQQIVDKYIADKEKYDELVDNFDNDRLALFKKESEAFAAQRTIALLKVMIDTDTVADSIKDQFNSSWESKFWSECQDITDLESAVESFRNKGK